MRHHGMRTVERLMNLSGWTLAGGGVGIAAFVAAGLQADTPPSQAKVPVFTLKVHEEGEADEGSWKPGSAVGTNEAEDLVKVEIYVPSEMEAAVKNTFSNMTAQDQITGERLVRLVFVMVGSKATSDCHPHNQRWHCHTN